MKYVITYNNGPTPEFVNLSKHTIGVMYHLVKSSDRARIFDCRKEAEVTIKDIYNLYNFKNNMCEVVTIDEALVLETMTA